MRKLGSTARKLAINPTQPTGTWIRPDLRLAIYLRDRNTCAYCGCSLKRVHLMERTLDHVYPDYEDNSPGNLVTACKGCNSAKKMDPPTRAALKKMAPRLAEDIAPYRALARQMIEKHDGYVNAVNKI